MAHDFNNILTVIMGNAEMLEINNKQKLWSNSHHFLGKDISWFHNIIWPAMLLSASHPLFQGTFVHSFFLVGGTKIKREQ